MENNNKYKEKKNEKRKLFIVYYIVLVEYSVNKRITTDKIDGKNYLTFSIKK